MGNTWDKKKMAGYVYGTTAESRTAMTNERKFWDAVYKIIGEASRLADHGYISDEDYTLIIQAVEKSIHRFREQQKEEN